MPLKTLIFLLTFVIAAAGLTIWSLSLSGGRLALIIPVALILSLVVHRLSRR